MKQVFVCVTALVLCPVQLAMAQAIKADRCAYHIRATVAAINTLVIAASCRSTKPILIAGRMKIPHDQVRDMATQARTQVKKVQGGWRLKPSGGVVRFSYRFDMKELLTETNSMSVARRVGRSLVTSISSFLLVPQDRPRPITLNFSLPKGTEIATGFHQDEEGAYHLNSRDLDLSGPMVFGRFTRKKMFYPAIANSVGNAKRNHLEVVLLDVPVAAGTKAVMDWIDGRGKAVTRYFHGFPARKALLVVYPIKGASRVHRGVVLSGGGPTILLQIGADVTKAQMANDWKLTHELIHVGSPYLRRRGRWLNEGTAVYLQSIIHIREGWVDEKQIWQGFMSQLPRGLGALQGDGLKSARGISGVYWGGALFSMLADVEIRKATGGRKSLGDCLRGVARGGGDSASIWTVERMMSACDKAVGTDVVGKLAARYVMRGSEVDLGKLWRDLGVDRGANGIVFDDKAPLAAIRKVIFKGRKKSALK